MFLTFTEQRVLPLVNVEEEFVADAEDSVEHQIERCLTFKKCISHLDKCFTLQMCVYTIAG